MVYIFYMQTRMPVYKPRKAKPQEYMQNLVITNYNENGLVKNVLQAQRWEFIPNNGRSNLFKPQVVLHKPNGDVWYLNSARALAWHPTIRAKITLIEMLDGVVIERPPINDATPVKIETRALQYEPDQEKISSTEFVSMQQPGLMISGYGMHGFLDRNWIELHDKITTIYTPMPAH